MIERLTRPLTLARIGHAGRLTRGSAAVRRVLTAQFAVFLMSLGHDEVLQEMVEAGWLSARHATLAEVAVGFVLFLCWGWLSVRLVRLLDAARREGEVVPGAR